MSMSGGELDDAIPMSKKIVLRLKSFNNKSGPLAAVVIHVEVKFSCPSIIFLNQLR